MPRIEYTGRTLTSGGTEQTVTTLISSLKQYRQHGDRWAFIFAKEKRAGICRVIYCKRMARTEVRRENGKLRSIGHFVCTTCRSRLHRANNPAREAYRQIRDRAQRRNQIFAITFEEFCAIPRFEEYLRNRGRGIHELHMDRVRVELGYVPGNLQVLTTEENLRKQREVDYAREPF